MGLQLHVLELIHVCATLLLLLLLLLRHVGGI